MKYKQWTANDFDKIPICNMIFSHWDSKKINATIDYNKHCGWAIYYYYNYNKEIEEYDNCDIYEVPHNINQLFDLIGYKAKKELSAELKRLDAEKEKLLI